MKTIEEYLVDYFVKLNDLKTKGESWRIRVSVEEFIEGIEKIREYGKTARQSSYLNEYHIRRNEDAQVAVMLMDRMTREECVAQSLKLKEGATFYNA